MEDSQKSVWNFDGAQFYNIFQLKIKFMDHLMAWDLENCYWTLRMIRMEWDAKLKRADRIKVGDDYEQRQKNVEVEKEEMDRLMDELTNYRNNYNYKVTHDGNEMADYFQVLEKFYMHLCYSMKKHGVVYREGDDSRFAVLKR